MGVAGRGLGILLENQQVTKVLASYVGENKLFARQYLDGTLEVEFVPQGTLAAWLRAGGITPGVYVQRLVPATARVKDIEQRTVRPRPAA